MIASKDVREDHVFVSEAVRRTRDEGNYLLFNFREADGALVRVPLWLHLRFRPFLSTALAFPAAVADMLHCLHQILLGIRQPHCTMCRFGCALLLASMVLNSINTASLYPLHWFTRWSDLQKSSSCGKDIS